MKQLVRLYLLGFKGLSILNNALNNDYDIIKEVIIGKDKNIENDYSDNIEDFCINYGIKYKFRSDDLEFDDTISIAVGWRWIIDLNRIPNLIVIHDSLLPKYRGFNPLVTALINGDEKIGVTALYASNSYDKGDIIYQDSINISYPIKIQNAIDLISKCYVNVLKKILAQIINHQQLPRIIQLEENASYSLWRDEDDYRINWFSSSDKINRFIDAVGFPYKGARTIINNQTYIVRDSSLINDLNVVNRNPGKILYFENNKPVVVCGKGLILINSIFNIITGDELIINSIRTRFI